MSPSAFGGRHGSANSIEIRKEKGMLTPWPDNRDIPPAATSTTCSIAPQLAHTIREKRNGDVIS